MLAEYIYLGDQLLSMIKPGEAVYYFHNDHLGTPQVLTDDTQTIAWKAVYTPFGDAVASIQTVENPFRFPGQYYDPETGLHYNYFRYYNPQTGRYITPDPIGLEGGLNLFAYVQNNPTNQIDPGGLLPGGGPNATIRPLWPPSPTRRILGPSKSCIEGCHPKTYGPPCNTSFTDCCKKCIETLNPWWTIPTSAGIGVTAVVAKGSIATGAATAGVALTGWEAGGSVGCAFVCGVNPCYYDAF